MATMIPRLRIPRGHPAPTACPLIMGILNITPDSFSDGGDFSSVALAVERAQEMVREGVDIIDVGPESTRPGSREVSAQEQISRAVPVIDAIRRVDRQTPISIDTRLAQVAQAALDAGADMINDVSALQDDPEMATVAAQAGVPICLMHRRGRSVDMQRGGGPEYVNVLDEISTFLREQVDYATARGIDAARIIIDPGIGFGKRVEHNLLIVKHLGRFLKLGRPLLLGVSRKAFIGTVLGIEDPKQRASGSLACAALATMAGVSILRVHDVRSTVEVARLCTAVRQARVGRNFYAIQPSTE